MYGLQGRPIEILLVEDDPEDAELVAGVIGEGRRVRNLQRAGSGEEALEILRSGGLRPDLVILDLNMPRKPDGRDVLAAIKKDPILHRIPVIVLTASAEEPDVNSCYELCANAYVVKPKDRAELVKAIENLEAFWLQVVTLIPR